uniref:Uncharacterized protein n=1 Tax=Knipowitschia caucasica TaxID=637954 RepID=A0AAV2MAX4_KNICA
MWVGFGCVGFGGGGFDYGIGYMGWGCLGGCKGEVGDGMGEGGCGSGGMLCCGVGWVMEGGFVRRWGGGGGVGCGGVC